MVVNQSINVWDAVFKPSFSSKYFPPTAEYSRSLYPDIYTHNVIARKVAELLKLTVTGKFPLSPVSKLSIEDEKILLAIDPWEPPYSSSLKLPDLIDILHTEKLM